LIPLFELLGKVWFVVLLSFAYKAYFTVEAALWTPYGACAELRCAELCPRASRHLSCTAFT
jgi:uncharacterized membrane protein